MFVTSPAEILKLVDSIDPIRYGNTRNYGNGAVTKLSPYISRGVISTKQVAKAILAKGFKLPSEHTMYLGSAECTEVNQYNFIILCSGNKIHKAF